jgi:hypothetical protein
MNKLLTYCLLLSLFYWNCGISVHTIELVDEWGNTYSDKQTIQTQSEAIFDENVTDIWGLEKTNCKNISKFDSLAKTGKSCLRIQWNKTENCPWLGMGIGWNGYAAKDVSEWIENGSLSFDLRSTQGNAFIPTLIFLLEDYNGKQAAAVLKSSHLSAYPINENWQKVSIPLSLFNDNNSTKCDFSFIKSLNIELQGSGDFLIDNIELIRQKSTNTIKNKYGETITRILPVTIFDGNEANYWGFGVFANRTIVVDTTLLLNGKPCIHVKKFDADNNPTSNEIGMTWENWEATSFADSLQNLYLELTVKGNPNTIELGFESFKGQKTSINLSEQFLTKDSLGWETFNIPLTAFPFKKVNFQTKYFKQLICVFNKNGEVFLGNIQIKKYK